MGGTSMRASHTSIAVLPKTTILPGSVLITGFGNSTKMQEEGKSGLHMNNRPTSK